MSLYGADEHDQRPDGSSTTRVERHLYNRGETRPAEPHAQNPERGAPLPATPQTWPQRRAEAIKRLPDFAEVVERDDLKITPIMAHAIAHQEHGTDIAYHLGRNPQEAARIAALAPIDQAQAIGRLSATVKAVPSQSQPRSAPQRARRSNEPTMEDYAARRLRELAAARGRMFLEAPKR